MRRPKSFQPTKRPESQFEEKQMYRFFGVVGLVVFATVACPQIVSADELCDRAYAEATAAIEKQDLKKSISVIDAAFEAMAKDKRVRLDEEVGPLYWIRAQSKGRLKQWQGAMSDYRQSIKYLPDNMTVLNEAAWMAATAPDAKARDAKFAVACAKKLEEYLNGLDGLSFALELSRIANLIDTMAACYAESKDFKAAVAKQLEATNLIEYGPFGQLSSNPKRLNLTKEKEATLLEFKARLELYRNSKPFRSE